MAIDLDLTGPQQSRLDNWHWLHFPGADGRQLYTMTGRVHVAFRGTGASWRRDAVKLTLPFPAETIPAGQALEVEHCTPSFGLGTVLNEDHAVNAGWAVDGFEGPGSPAAIRDALPLTVLVGARDTDGELATLTFHVTVSGRFVEQATGPAVRVRRDVWKLPEWDPILLWWARAINAMHARPLDDPTSWRYQAAIHAYNRAGDPYADPNDALPGQGDQDRFWNQCQHGSWYFLPWHRMYLGYFERIVAKTVADLGGPTDWALPYWNYSDATNPSEVRRLPPAFRAAQTPDGDPNPLRVEQRAPGANDGDVIADDLDVDIQRCLVDPVFTGVAGGGDNGFGGGRTAFSHSGRAAGSLEITPHGSMHMAVGGFAPAGFMSRFNTAGLDPTFWMHHANIDRLWTVWKNRDPQHVDPNEADWLANLAFELHDENGAVVSMTCAEIVDTATSPFAYRYEDVSDPLPAPGPGTEALTAAPRGLGREMERPIPEMVGASEGKIRLSGGPETARVPMSRPSGPAAAGAGLEGLAGRRAKPSRVHLNIENVTGLEPMPYRVYVNLPEGADPADHPERLAGALPMFGVPEASGEDPEHAADGVDYTLDITALVERLGDEWDPAEMRVTFVPKAPPPAGGLEGLAAPAPPAPIEVGRVSVYESR